MEKVNEIEMVSIIVPVYNCEKYINRCVESLLSQTYKNLEIIFIDDKSTDRSYELLKKYSKYCNIKIKKNDKNRGVSYSRNSGLASASGGYIMFVDADDFITKDCVENLYYNIIKEDADIICCNVIPFKSDMDINYINQNHSSVIINAKEINKLQSSILDNSTFKVDSQKFGFSCGKLYKREMLNNIYFDENIRFREDTLFNLQVYNKAKKILYINKNFYFYFTNPESASFKFFDNYEKEINKFFEKIYLINKSSNISKDSIFVCGLYMYMTYLKHYAMHNNLTNISHNSAIVKSFNSTLWNNFFVNVNYKKISLPYKILRVLFLRKMSYAIMILYKINEWTKG